MSSKGWTYVVSGVIGAVSVGAQILVNVLLDKQTDINIEMIEATKNKAVADIAKAKEGGNSSNKS